MSETTLTNPVPYIVASYTLGTFIIFGLSLYMLAQKAKLKKLLAVIDQGKD